MEQANRFRQSEHLGEITIKAFLCSTEVINSFKLDMILANRDLPLVPIQCEFLNGSETLVYRLGNRIALSSMLDYEKEPRMVMLKLIQAIKRLAESHIYLEDLALDLEQLYFSTTEKRVEFLCLPLRNNSIDAWSALKRTLSRLLKMPGFAIGVSSWEILEISELLYNQHQGSEVLDRLMTLIQNGAKSPESPAATTIPAKPIKSAEAFNIKSIRVMRGNLNPLHSSLYLLPLMGGVGSWISPMGLEAKIGTSLLGLSISIWLYQRFSHKDKLNQKTVSGPSRLSTSTSEEVKLNKKKGLLQSEPSIVQDLKVNVTTGEVETTYPVDTAKSVVNQTVWLKEEGKALSLWIEEEGNKAYRLQAVQTIGRNDGICQVVLKHLSVGRVHAELHVNGDKVYIKDLNSLNGTFVNQRRIEANVYIELSKGDRIGFGEVGGFLK